MVYSIQHSSYFRIQLFDTSVVVGKIAACPREVRIIGWSGNFFFIYIIETILKKGPVRITDINLGKERFGMTSQILPAFKFELLVQICVKRPINLSIPWTTDDVSRHVPIALKMLGYRQYLLRKIRFQAIRIPHMMSANASSVHTHGQCGPARGTDRGRSKNVGKFYALSCQSIDIRRAHQLVAIGSHILRKILSHNPDNIRP